MPSAYRKVPVLTPLFMKQIGEQCRFAPKDASVSANQIAEKSGSSIMTDWVSAITSRKNFIFCGSIIARPRVISFECFVKVKVSMLCHAKTNSAFELLTKFPAPNWDKGEGIKPVRYSSPKLPVFQTPQKSGWKRMETLAVRNPRAATLSQSTRWTNQYDLRLRR